MLAALPSRSKVTKPKPTSPRPKKAGIQGEAAEVGLKPNLQPAFGAGRAGRGASGGSYTLNRMNKISSSLTT